METKKYNLFILMPNLTDDEITNANGEVLELIKKYEGEVIKEEKYGKRKLSYTVNKIRHGFYMDYVINIAVDKIDEFKKELKLNANVVRFELSKFVESKKILKERKTPKVKDEKENSDPNLRIHPNDPNDVKKDDKDKPKVSMEELNAKLDNILETDNI